MEFQIDYSDIEKLGKVLNEAPDIIQAELRRTMQTSVDFVEDQVVRRTPVNTGQLRQGITSQVRGRRLDIEGRVFAGGVGSVYGWPVERGRKPGKFPPVGAIEMWVIRKGIAQGNEATSVAFLIARHIARHGTKGVHMFEEGLSASEATINRLWGEAGANITKRIQQRLG